MTLTEKTELIGEIKPLWAKVLSPLLVFGKGFTFTLLKRGFKVTMLLHVRKKASLGNLSLEAPQY